MTSYSDLLQINRNSLEATLKRLKKGFPPFFNAATTNDFGCILAQKATNKSNGKGYVKCKVAGSRKEFYAHHIALVVANRDNELSQVRHLNYEISHLCHNPRCFNASHLVAESKAVNLSRLSCYYQSLIECPACKHEFSLCNHEPRCLLRPPLFTKQG